MGIFRILLWSSPALIILQSCKKENNEPPPNPSTNCGTRLRMVSVLDKGSSTTYFRSFFYNGTGRVENFVDSTLTPADNGIYLGVSSDIKHVDYDPDSRITQITERLGEPDSIYELRFYNSENLVVKNIFISKLDKDTVTDTYSYDTQKRLVIDSVFYNKSTSLVKYTTFRYDPNDNVVEWIRYTNASGAFEIDYTADATYDDHPNPFHDVVLYAIPFEGDNIGLSRNNIVSLSYSSGTVTTYHYQYQYCGNGWPQSAVVTHDAGQAIVRNIGFDYY